MDKFELTTPVAFFTFNRLDTAKEVFARIKEAKPPKLYLVSDGPRATKEGEADKVNEVRSYLESSIDWECQVIKNYAPENMGCGRRMSSGIKWVFEHEEEAIFLEDDCVPDMSFFRYCQEMLAKYRNNPEIYVICGNNQISKAYKIQGDYAFSHILNIWGWAGYRRSFEDYDFDMKDWPLMKKAPVWKKIYKTKARLSLLSEYDIMYDKKCDTWDYQVSYMMGKHEGYCIIPRVNMISNAGFSAAESTHTVEQPEWMDLTSSSIEFPLAHPDRVSWSEDYDEALTGYYFKHGVTVYIKHMLGLDINKSILEIFKK